MPNATTRFVTWISRGRRNHGSAYADIAAPTHSNLSTGDTFATSWASPVITWTDSTGMMRNARFAFWSVTGGIGGGIISAPGTNTALPVTVGSSNVVATAWYIEGGGPGDDSAGVFADAFDVSQGRFVDDNFVNVMPDSSLTASVNETGFMPTAAAENIEAYNYIHAVPFAEWRVVMGSETVSNRDVTITENSSAVAFAFYQIPAGTGGIVAPGFNYKESTWVSWGVTVDGGGPTGKGPVDPWDPMMHEFAAGMALAQASGKVNSKLKAQVLEIAAQQIALAAQQIQRAMVQAHEVTNGLYAKEEINGN